MATESGLRVYTAVILPTPYPGWSAEKADGKLNGVSGAYFTFLAFIRDIDHRPAVVEHNRVPAVDRSGGWFRLGGAPGTGSNFIASGIEIVFGIMLNALHSDKIKSSLKCLVKKHQNDTYIILKTKV